MEEEMLVIAAAVHPHQTVVCAPMRGDRGGRGVVVIAAVRAAAPVGTSLLSLLALALLVLIEAHAGDGAGGNAGTGSRRFAATRARGAGAGAGAALRFVVASHLDVASCIALAFVVVLESEAALAILRRWWLYDGDGGGNGDCGLWSWSAYLRGGVNLHGVDTTIRELVKTNVNGNLPLPLLVSLEPSLTTRNPLLRQPPSKAETATKLEDIEDEHPLGCFRDVADGRMGVDGDERPTTWTLMER
ncbi:hypothetical protein BD410DRAFT_798626 [Rickenella mellea]|uniref:Uncharacterized protein n=1 Tax=Rickenella mellea TaxID=50990 RepID=A0A4Y7QN53_9AGAM|nr:hypothetical protein BD410DRAFT_798626 [Rickenella mellea]